MNILSAITVGKDKTREELQESVNKINAYIKENGNLDFYEQANTADTKAQYDKFSEYIKPDEISNKEANKKMKVRVC